MCTVYNFPKQFKIPKEMEERLQHAVDEYVGIITESLDYFVDEDTTEEEYEKITGMILETVTSCLVNAIEDI